MKLLREWAAGKPIAAVCASLMGVVAAENCYRILRGIREGNLKYPASAVPDVKSWLRLYRRSRSFTRQLCEEVGPVGKADTFDLLLAARQIRLMPVEKLRDELSRVPDSEYASALKESQQFWNEQIVGALADAEGNDDDNAGLMLDGDAIGTAGELLFFILVWLPCWLEYRQMPSQLLRRARSGELEALEYLLRIDKSVIADPKVRELFHRAAHDCKDRTYRRLLSAFGGRPEGQFSRGRVKRQLAGLLSLLFHSIGHRVTEPELRDLFDLVARIRGTRIDDDIPDSHEAFAKALQRERADWGALFRQPGQK